MSSFLLKGTYATAQGTPYRGQPLSGPGGADYAHRSVLYYDAAATADGYWLFEPANPKPDSAHVVVFLHGYGTYNPMAYGKWIKHLVGKGNIVIYPRYQKNLVWPRPDAFPANAAKAIRDALQHLQSGEHVRPIISKTAYIGHSYGGAIAAKLGVDWPKLDIPKPASMLLCEPGTGPFTGARQKSYANLPSDLKLIVVVGEDDYVVGDAFGRLVYQTAVHTPERSFVVQRKSTDGRHWLNAGHSEPYSYDLDFDTGLRNLTARRVLMSSRLNEVDFYCYWKFADAMMDYTRQGHNREMIFGNTEKQRFLGRWPNGKPMGPLEILEPGH